jgi:hypothetical protein
LPAPDDQQVFARCKLDFRTREKSPAYNLHDLLKLRREDSRFGSRFRRNRWGLTQ